MRLHLPLYLCAQSTLYYTNMTPEREQRIKSVLAKRQNDLTVVLENVFDAHNVSAIMRSCDAVGIQEIYVVNTFAPAHKNWGYRSSGSAYKWVTVHQYDDIEKCVADVKKKYDRIFTTHLTADAVSLYKLNLALKTALVFGNEQKGISEEMMGLCDGNFIIPQMGMIRSLNISVACAVTLYEAYRQKAAAGHYENQKLDEATFNQLSKEWGIDENV